MTALELRQQCEWMPDDYKIIIVSSNYVQEEAELDELDIQPDHENKRIIITAN